MRKRPRLLIMWWLPLALTLLPFGNACWSYGFLWEKVVYSSSNDVKSVGIDDVLPDGTAIVSAAGSSADGDSYGKLLAYNPAGALQWSHDTGGFPNAMLSPDQTMIYAAINTFNYDGTDLECGASLLAFNGSGSFQWEKELYSPRPASYISA